MSRAIRGNSVAAPPVIIVRPRGWPRPPSVLPTNLSHDEPVMNQLSPDEAMRAALREFDVWPAVHEDPRLALSGRIDRDFTYYAVLLVYERVAELILRTPDGARAVVDQVLVALGRPADLEPPVALAALQRTVMRDELYDIGLWVAEAALAARE